MCHLVTTLMLGPSWRCSSCFWLWVWLPANYDLLLRGIATSCCWDKGYNNFWVEVLRFIIRSSPSQTPLDSMGWVERVGLCSLAFLDFLLCFFFFSEIGSIGSSYLSMTAGSLRLFVWCGTSGGRATTTPAPLPPLRGLGVLIEEVSPPLLVVLFL